MYKPLLICVLLLASCANSTDKLEQVFNENELVGLAVAEIRDDGSVQENYFGHADIEQGMYLNQHSSMRIASISKTLVAYALHELADQGKIDLDADVSNYLGFELNNPRFPNKIITTRQLLSHTSSIKDGEPYSDFLKASYHEYPVPTIRKFMLDENSEIREDMFTSSEAGSEFIYSNFNYGLAGTILESIVRKRFDHYIQENILIPNGINATWEFHDTDKSNRTVLYRNAIPQHDHYNGVYPNAEKPQYYLFGTNAIRMSPHGGLRASMKDLIKIVQLYQSKNEKNPCFAESWNSSMPSLENSNSLFRAYSPGFQIFDMNDYASKWPRKRCYGHLGEAYGLLGGIFFHPDRNEALVYLITGFYGEAGYADGNFSAFYLPEEQIIDQWMKSQ